MPPLAEERSALDHRAAFGLELPDQHGHIQRLEDFRGQNLILYFYPKDDTPGCTVEGKEFRELHDQFVGLECVVAGASVDSVESHRAFADQHGFPFILLSDARGELARAFGVLEDGMAHRSTFVFDRDLRLVRAFREVTPRGHAQRVLNFVRTLLESHRMLGG
ncbi:MAG: peroxiredoxin [Candidatus Binataceae bacterium]